MNSILLLLQLIFLKNFIVKNVPQPRRVIKYKGPETDVSVRELVDAQSAGPHG